MVDQMKNVLIGVFVIVAAIIVIFVLMFLHPTVGDEGRLLRVRFANIDKVNVGTRVTLAGKPVGEVVDIREVEFGRAGKADSNGHIYIYELDLRVDSSVHVFNTDEISLMTSGLLGERNIEISPIAPKKDGELKIVDNDVIFAQETGSLEETLAELREVGQKIGDTLDAITVTVKKIQSEKVVERLANTARNLSDITGALNKPKELGESIDNIKLFTQGINKSLESVDKVIVNFSDLSGKGKVIFEDFSAGKGSFGKILVNEDLYLRMTSLLSKGETVLDDINHYGLLFNTDKGWQRLRARRLNLLQQLCTPQEFRNYFNDEVDMINTSLARVAMVMNHDGCNPCNSDMLQNPEFTKVFAELLRRVSMMEEELKMYNIQAVEAQVHQTELSNCCECLECY